MITQKLIETLKDKNYTLSIAESCTAGMISAEITNISGSSAVFMGGIIAYDNQVKLNVLKLSENILRKYGAVSSEAVLAMTDNIKKIMKTDCSITVSGISGPGGGTKEKPVGLVYIAVSTPVKTKSFKHIFSGNRQENREQTVEFAIKHLLELLN